MPAEFEEQQRHWQQNTSCRFYILDNIFVFIPFRCVHSCGYVVLCHCGLICICLITNDVGHFFVWLLAIFLCEIFSFVKLFEYSAHILIELFLF